jgi:hypothetical protein
MLDYAESNVCGETAGTLKERADRYAVEEAYNQATFREAAYVTDLQKWLDLSA